MRNTDNLNVLSLKPVITPAALRRDLPMNDRASETVATGREAIQRILDKEDKRLIVVVGPCSIHDPKAALDYARRLALLKDELSDRLCIVMRVYFEKPRTTVGWKGLINDPGLDGSYDMETGVRKAREILLRVNELGLPAGSEVLDPVIPQYMADLLAWVSIGARTSESQTHREMSSGLSMPVGFKNSTDGNLQVAIDAQIASAWPHHFLGIDEEGRSCIVATRGNRYGHIILRGGYSGPNYDPVSVIQAEEQLRAAGQEPRIMVDCSHANSGKRPHLQAHVLRDVVQQRIDGSTSLIGVMVESNIKGGNQKLTSRPDQLEYGLSITDSCLDWETTERLLRESHDRLGTCSACYLQGK